MNIKRFLNRHDFWLFLCINTFVYVASASYNPFISTFYKLQGISATRIGILLTIGPLVSIFIQPIWANLSDRSGKYRRVLMFVSLSCAFSMLGYYLGNTFLLYFVVTLIATSFTTALVPLTDAVIIRTCERKHLDFSRIRIGGTVGYAAVVLVIGRYLKEYPAFQFTLAFFGYFILFCFIAMLPSEKNVTSPSARSKRGLQLSSISSCFVSHNIYFILIFALIGQVGLSINSSFFSLYIMERGYTQTEIGIINCISAMSEVPVLLIISRIIKKFSTLRLIILADLLIGIRLILISTGLMPFFIFSASMQGITYMIIYFSCVMYINNNTREGYKSQGQSILTMVQTGIGSITANAVGGRIIDLIGLRSSFLLSGFLILTLDLLLAGFIFLMKKQH